ncbi:helix-hairpin-helix domain-containing protein [Zhaonella formicivorans]|uniref:helix-hairpin-helix domain-containing protein n=1 Tax=Zhaonella formicivorans TaxID=2528593 RepID=UPI0010F14902|nr:helix-hairpin-helix domain-containing protein [Zhaonella formicivorans]
MWEQLPRQVKSLFLILLAALIFGSGMLLAKVLHPVPKAEAEIALEQAPAAVEEKGLKEPEGVKEILVHISGAVEKPGVYSLKSGSRVNDAVFLAVPLAEADLDALNLAAPLVDGQKIPVPKKGEAPPQIAGAQGISSGSGTGKVNINTAGLAELDSLPGIGPATAQKIIDYRTQHGGFKSVEELDQVSGIGAKKLEELKELVTIY